MVSDHGLRPWSRKGPDHGVGVDPEIVKNLSASRSAFGHLAQSACKVLAFGGFRSARKHSKSGPRSTSGTPELGGQKHSSVHSLGRLSPHTERSGPCTGMRHLVDQLQNRKTQTSRK